MTALHGLLFAIAFFVLFLICLFEDKKHYEERLEKVKRPKNPVKYDGKVRIVFDVEEHDAAMVHAFNPDRPSNRR